MSDLIVVVPGIGGSRLAAADGTVLWDASWIGLAKQAASWGRRFDGLAPPPDGHDDGIHPEELVTGITVIPGFWNYGSYAPLTSGLKRRFGPPNVVEFAYDWRRSNEHAAAQLGNFVKCHGGNQPDRRVVIVAHSMGGIVARRYLTHHGGAGNCRLLITIGTPYRGAAKAVHRLVNGIPLLPGGFGERLVRFLQACPSVYELLPRYDCFEREGDDKRFGFRDWLPPRLDNKKVELASRFHDEIDEAVAAGTVSGVDTAAILGHRQKTSRYLTVSQAGKIKPRKELWVGDGTVPQGSAQPPEWGDVVRGTLPFWATHLDLASSNAVYRAVEGLISGQEFSQLGPEDDDGLSLSLPEVASPDDRIPVRVRTRKKRLDITASVQEDTMPLQAMTRLTATSGVKLDNDELVVYEGRLGPLPSGIYQVTIRAGAGGAPCSVSDAVTVLPTEDDDEADDDDLS
jgi:pimeloyl-ACP methyl ester carboxylesterase